VKGRVSSPRGDPVFFLLRPGNLLASPMAAGEADTGKTPAVHEIM
jgi:hypothetical protein